MAIEMLLLGTGVEYHVQRSPVGCDDILFVQRASEKLFVRRWLMVLFILRTIDTLSIEIYFFNYDLQSNITAIRVCFLYKSLEALELDVFFNIVEETQNYHT